MKLAKKHTTKITRIHTDNRAEKSRAARPAYILIAAALASATLLSACGPRETGPDDQTPAGAYASAFVSTDAPASSPVPVGTDPDKTAPAAATGYPAVTDGQNETAVPGESTATAPATSSPGISAPAEEPTDRTASATPSANPAEPSTGGPSQQPTQKPAGTSGATPEPTGKTTSGPTPEQTPGPTPGPDNNNITLSLPENNLVFSKIFALELLAIADSDGANEFAESIRSYGFNVIEQNNYNKTNEDRSHTSGYTLAKGTADAGGVKRDVFIISVNDTDKGEWYSNIDYAPSHSDETEYAECFKLAADGIFAGTKQHIASSENAILIITGYSRGAAVADLLALSYNDMRDPALNYVYTFAVPNCLHIPSGTGLRNQTYADNVFNIINPADPVAGMPFAESGFYRPGKEITLAAPQSMVRFWQTTKAGLTGLADSVSGYYNDRHSLTGPGLSEDGMTTYEFVLYLVDYVFSLSTDDMDFSDISDSEIMTFIKGIDSRSDLYPMRKLAESATNLFGQAQLFLLISNHTTATYRSLLSSY